MSNAFFFVTAAAILGVMVVRANRNSEKSFAKAAVRSATLSRDNVKECGFDSLANEAVNPMLIKSCANKAAPVVKKERGPWGVPRQMRQEPRTCVQIPTYGDFFNQL